ncbi:hypothetical protein BURPS305_0185 [Burkholderia pseudomallei 305]|nr:hypothetical protein BURPS305_0185 [Burkholderia pseudomallei 305]
MRARRSAARANHLAGFDSSGHFNISPKGSLDLPFGIAYRFARAARGGRARLSAARRTGAIGDLVP